MSSAFPLPVVLRVRPDQAVLVLQPVAGLLDPARAARIAPAIDILRLGIIMVVVGSRAVDRAGRAVQPVFGIGKMQRRAGRAAGRAAARNAVDRRALTIKGDSPQLKISKFFPPIPFII